MDGDLLSDEHGSREELLAELRVLRERVAALELHQSASPLFSAESATRYRDLLQQVRAVLTQSDADGRFVYLSSTLGSVLGFEVRALVGQPEDCWVHPDDRAALRADLAALRRAGGSIRSAYRGRDAQGDELWLEISASLAPGSDGSSRVVAFWRDATPMRRAEDALRESEDRYRAIAENASDLVVEIDSEGRILFVSPNSEALVGRPYPELLGRSIGEAFISSAIHHDDSRGLVEGFQRRLAEGDLGSVTYRFRHPDGSWRWFESRTQGYRTTDRQRRAVVITRDVTERELALREVRRSESRYRLVTEASGDLISETDSKGRLTYANGTFQSVLGYTPESLVGRSTLGLLHEDDLEGFLEVYREGVRSERPIHVGPHRLRHRDGRWVWVEATGVFFRNGRGELRTLGVARDITGRISAEQRRAELEQRMQQAQKLEGLGVLAGGIAHDFNNLLTPILGDASLALQDLPPDSPLYRRIEKIRSAARRAAALTNQMLTYAGQGLLQVEPVDLSRAVEEIGQLLQTAASHEAVLGYELDPDLPPIEADPAQLSQVIMNLITNASEALDGGSGRVVVRTSAVVADRALLDRSYLGEELPEGGYVTFEVSDTGTGMDAKTLTRIFDPFFTTKFTGRGLGLAAVLGIVRGHRGAIEIESEVGRGTRVRVLFPEAVAVPAEPSAEPASREAWRGSGMLLVIDDDEGVRDLAKVALERAGFEVLAAKGGREGIELFRRRAGEITGVLLDRTMPEISGEEAFAEIRRISPEARVILVSGYSQERAAEHLIDQGLAGFLQKPFLPQDLVEAVRRLFDA